MATKGSQNSNSLEQSTYEADVHELHRLGYAQELVRRMSGFSNFAISFAIICIVGGRHHRVRHRAERGRRRVDRHRLADRRFICVYRGDVDGTDCLGLPNRRRPLSLGVDPGRPGLWLGHRLV